ncbi:MAG: hypothetical protein ABIF19_20065 [Planctomycetota bacterium]
MSNRSKVSYPFFRRIHNGIEEEILNLKALLCENCNIESAASLYEVLAESVKWLGSRIDGEADNQREVTVEIARSYDKNSYRGSKFCPVNSLCGYVRKKLEPYLAGAYIHGSVSTMDYTDYSDLDTLFVIKNEAVEDPDKIRELERLLIKSTRYLYEFDSLQHHGHFFLTESDLRYYSQSILPLAAIRLSTSILSRGNNLTFRLRDSSRESKLRFLDSIRIVRRYVKKDRGRLETPYYLKGFLSHFMMLPVLFLQLEGQYVSKKKSFQIMKERVPSDTWRCMEQVSEIRLNWDQATSAFRQRLMNMVGVWNPLLLPFFSIHLHPCRPFGSSIVDSRLLDEMLDFATHLLELSGLHEDRQSRIC